MSKQPVTKNWKPVRALGAGGFSWILLALSAALLFTVSFFLFWPNVIIWSETHEPFSLNDAPFPVTVDPKNKTIVEDPNVEAMLIKENAPLAAALTGVGDLFQVIARALSEASWYRMLAAANAPRFVTIQAGYRKEQAAAAFAKELGWNQKTKEAFLENMKNAPPYLPEGNFYPGTYLIEPDKIPKDIELIVGKRFEKNILARYATTTREIVPLVQALTIASMIEREAGDQEEMRVISGIMWNRTFADMKLQIDSTLQYARGTNRNGWWPIVRSRDKYIKSPFNTYLHVGLPPAPIASPSVSAVIAALNPKKTSCLFYFHDDDGGFHCSDTYKEHVALLKKYYGRGK